MIKRIVSIGVLTLVTLYLVAGFTVLNRKPSDWVCKELNVMIKDSSFITKEEVHAVLKANRLYPINKPADSIDSRLIEQALLKNPYVRRVECYKTPYNSLCIHVEQRLPILRILNSSGQNYYIDHLGDAMPVSTSFSSACRLTVATGYIETEFARNELYEFACLLRERPFWEKQIQQINVTSQGEIELIPRVGNHILFLGRPTNLSEKLDRLELFYSKVLGQIGWNKYSRISVEFDNQVICKRWE